MVTWSPGTLGVLCGLLALGYVSGYVPMNQILRSSKRLHAIDAFNDDATNHLEDETDETWVVVISLQTQIAMKYYVLFFGFVVGVCAGGLIGSLALFGLRDIMYGPLHCEIENYALNHNLSKALARGDVTGITGMTSTSTTNLGGTTMGGTTMGGTTMGGDETESPGETTKGGDTTNADGTTAGGTTAGGTTAGGTTTGGGKKKKKKKKSKKKKSGKTTTKQNEDDD